MKILILGDPHGRAGILYGQQLAKEHGCAQVMFMGDCWNVAEDYSNGVPVHVIKGNHEQWGQWLAAHDGIKNITRHHDYTTFMLGGLRFGVIGRIDRESHAHLYDTRRRLWMGITNNGSNEVYFEKDHAKLQGMGKLDVLLTHDAPYPFEVGGDVAGSAWLTEAIMVTKPLMQFGGHMHKSLNRMIRDTNCYQLPAMQDINEGYDECYGVILDTDTHGLYEVGYVGL